MARAKFSGNSAYELDAVARRSGSTITVTVKVIRTSNYWAVWEGQLPWSVTIDGSKQSDTWNYDFRNTTSKTLGSKSRSGLSFGSKSWSVTVEMASGIGTATVSGSISIPPNQPIDPTLYGVDRVSDTRHTVRFRRRATSTAPYATMVLQRAEWVNGNWGTWRNIANWGYSSSATDMTYTDTGTVANKAYLYRVAAYNSAGSGLSGNSDTIRTTPAPPTSVVAESVSASEVQVTLSRDVGYVTYETQLQYSSAGGAWTTLATLDRWTDTYTWEPPAGATVQVRARNVATGSSLASAYRNSNIVPLQAPPLAPSNLAPNGVSVDRSQPAALTWRHNSVDTSLQRSYEIQTRIGSAWTSHGKKNHPVSRASLPLSGFSTGSTVYWRVRTWGVHADPGPWSTQASITVAEAPTVNIESPVGLATSSEALLEWSTVPGQAQYRAELYHNSTRVETRSGSGSATSVRFNTLLLNGENYKVRLQVQDSTGLWSPWVESEFLAEFPTPSPPQFTLAWDDERGATLVDIYNDVVGPQNLVLNPRMEATSGTVEVRRNLCKNPSFETGLTGVYAGSATERATTTYPGSTYSGSQALLTTVTGASTSNGYIAQDVTAVPGEWLAWSLSIRRSTGPTHFRLFVTFPGTTTPDMWLTDWLPMGAGNMADLPRVTTSLLVPDGVTTVRLWVRLYGSAAGAAPADGNTFHDAWMVASDPNQNHALKKVSEYFDGSTSPDPDLTASWVGAANASESVLTGLGVANLAAGATNWTSEPYQITEPDGSKAARFITGTASLIAVPISNVSTPIGVTRTVLFQVRPSVDIVARPRVGNDSSATSGMIPAGQWTTLRTTGTSASAIASQTGLLMAGNKPGNTIDIRYALLTEGEYTGPYGDGDTPGWVWDGEPNASTSHRADTEDNLVYRSYDQETWELVQANVPPNATISDPEVVLNTEAFYRVVARSPLGTTEEGLIQSIFTEATAGYWSVGEGFYLGVKLRMDLGGPPGIDLSSGLVNKERHYFAGRTLPVEYVGTARQRSGQAHFMVGSVAEKNQVEDMSYMAAPHLFRLPDGTYLYASISDVAMLRQDEGFYTVKLTVTEVEK